MNFIKNNLIKKKCPNSLKNIKQFPSSDFFESEFKNVDEASKNWILGQKKIKENNARRDGLEIKDILTVNGVRFTLADGSWGLVRASSNKPSLVVVTESPVSDKIKTDIFRFIDDLLQKTGKIGEYDQKI